MGGPLPALRQWTDASPTRVVASSAIASVRDEIGWKHPPDDPRARRIALEAHHPAHLELDHRTVRVEAQQAGDQAAEVGQIADQHERSGLHHQPGARGLHVVVWREAGDLYAAFCRAESQRENLRGLPGAQLVAVLD